MELRPIIHRIITGSILGSFFWIIFTQLPVFVFSTLAAGILCHILLIEWHTLFHVRTPIFWALMPIYPILPFSFIISMNHQPLYRELLFALFVVVSTFDTGAYVIGSLFGKHKIAPSISPGKSWEGFWGGYLCALGGFIFLIRNKIADTSWILIPLFILGICILGTAGDLFESWLKRRAKVKDSGKILPGHGGFLDRFDGILITVFFVYFIKEFIINAFKL